MMSLFSPFDVYWFVAPMSFLLILLSSLLGFSSKFSPMKMLLSSVANSLVEFFLSLKPKFLNKSSSFIFLGVFLFLVTANLFSVFPYNFPATSQLFMVLMLSGAFWLSLVLFSLIKNFKGFTSHLIPEGTPLPLTCLLFLIELVSTLIRPLTLTVRLVANILAGHLLMSLLSSLVFIFNLSGLLYIGLNMVEMFVALIQAYIFTTMIVLYFSEV